jgi:hypothetical protein
MTMYIIGHSKHTDEPAFLPQGVTAYLYAPAETPLHSSDVLSVLSGKLKYVERRRIAVENYCIDEDESAELVREVAYKGTVEGRRLIVGVDFRAGTRLCSSPEKCGLERKKVHDCQGLLAWLGEGEEVHLVFCRGSSGGIFPGSAKEDALARGKLHWESKEKAKEFLRLTWDEMKRKWDLFSNDERIELLTSSKDVGNFLACLSVENYAQGSGLAAYRCHLSFERDPGGYRVDLTHAAPQGHPLVLIRDGKTVFDEVKQAADKWVDGQDEEGCEFCAIWEGIGAADQQHAVAVEDSLLTAKELKTSSIRWAAQSYAQKPNDQPWPSPPPEWFEGLDVHSWLQVKGAAENDSAIELTYHLAGDVLLVGDDTSWLAMEQWIAAQPGYQTGSLRVALDTRDEHDVYTLRGDFETDEKFVPILERWSSQIVDCAVRVGSRDDPGNSDRGAGERGEYDVDSDDPHFFE